MRRSFPANTRSRRTVVQEPTSSTGFETAGSLPKLQRNARYLYHRLEEHFGDTPIFTREDCLHVAFSEVATITRYNYIRETLRYLIDETAQVVEVSSTELALHGNHERALHVQHLSYLTTVTRLLIEHFTGRSFTITEVLDIWTSDQLLTRNSKRVAVRGCLARLVKEKKVVKREDYSYEITMPQKAARGARASARAKVAG